VVETGCGPYRAKGHQRRRRSSKQKKRDSPRTSLKVLHNTHAVSLEERGSKLVRRNGESERGARQPGQRWSARAQYFSSGKRGCRRGKDLLDLLRRTVGGVMGADSRKADRGVSSHRRKNNHTIFRIYVRRSIMVHEINQVNKMLRGPRGNGPSKYERHSEH